MTSPFFTEYEKRFLLAEILKASTTSLDKFLEFIRVESIDDNIDWQEIALPAGRNVKSCKQAFSELLELRGRRAIEAPSTSPRKRHYEEMASLPHKSRQLQPKPIATYGPKPEVESHPDTPRKRGRPSNASIAAARADAEARGEPFVVRSTPKQKASGSDATPKDVSGSESASRQPSGKRRGRPRKSLGADTDEPLEQVEGEVLTKNVEAAFGEVAERAIEATEQLTEPLVVEEAASSSRNPELERRERRQDSPPPSTTSPGDNHPTYTPYPGLSVSSAS